MKKLGIVVFIAFVFVAGLYALLQSPLGRNFAKEILSASLTQSGFEVQIDRIEGTLPHQIDLKGVAIQGRGIQIAIESLQLRPVLWRLFTKEAAFTDIHAKQISIDQSTPFDFDGKFRINQKRAVLEGKIADWKLSARFNRTENLAFITARNPLLNVKGTATFNPQHQLIGSNLQISSDQILAHLPFSASGRWLAHLIVHREGDSYQGRLNWQIPNLVVESVKIGPLKGTGEVVWQERTLKGVLNAEPLAKLTFDLAVGPHFLLSGTNELTVENLQSLHIPNSYGKLHGKALWKVENDEQKLQFDLNVSDFYYGSFFARKASLYSDLKDPFHNLSGLFDIEVEKAKWHDLELETASFETEANHFRLFAEGKWKHPLEIHAEGTWQPAFSAEIEHLYGTFYNHPFVLSHPIHFETTKDRFVLSEAEVAIAGAKAWIDIDREKDETEAHLRFDNLPLDFLSLNPLDVPIQGTLNLKADIQEKNNKLKGTLTADIDSIEIAQIKANMNGTGRFVGTFDRDLLQLKGDLLVNQKPLFDLNLSLPVHFSIWPFKADLLSYRDAKGQIAFHGRVEDVLDFFDLGPHRLEGQCDCALRFTNTLARPLIAGTIQFKDGFYQNYYTGTELHNIQADCLAEKNIIYLRSLTAEDASKTGALSADGEIHLLQADQYPFELDVRFQNLPFLEIDLVHATANGKVRIEGNALSALAKGDVQILQTHLEIPDHIPRPVPHLQVTYRNPIHPIAPPQTNYQPYPLHLDLQITAPQSVILSGRGLSSEWKGDFHLGGTYTDLAAKGKLELIDGEFHFSSRSFKLTEGSLSLSGVEHEMPYLNLAAVTETKGITITARLKGPLNDPQVTLHSSPALPLGSIMSYLLFGQDLSEISGFQALQLASSLAGLAGAGPDVMESTRRSLGVDRLRIITDPSEEGGETVALQVGKYVADGVLVSFTQGVGDSSPNISVEVEIKSNIVFQIESDQHQEQGRFTLKWNLNY